MEATMNDGQPKPVTEIEYRQALHAVNMNAIGRGLPPSIVIGQMRLEELDLYMFLREQAKPVIVRPNGFGPNGHAR